jgi:hypothetical protein
MEDKLSYERKMLEQLEMPSRRDVAHALLKTLINHQGVIKEFAAGEEIVDEIANIFQLNEQQRATYLKTIYRKENRIKKSLLWHRLLFRAADYLAKESLIVRPTITVQLTKRKEWMLTEKGYDEGLRLLNIPISSKNILPIKSYEVQKIVKKIVDRPRPKNYNPFDNEKKSVRITRDTILRNRGFRQAVIESYNYKCAVCGMKLNSPDAMLWEVEAAHIVPHRAKGKDDVLNGIALCRLHHWAFDVGWFTLLDNFKIQSSQKILSLPSDFGKSATYDFAKALVSNDSIIFLPNNSEIFPHHNSIRWHRENVFHY